MNLLVTKDTVKEIKERDMIYYDKYPTYYISQKDMNRITMSDNADEICADLGVDSVVLIAIGKFNGEDFVVTETDIDYYRFNLDAKV